MKPILLSISLALLFACNRQNDTALVNLVGGQTATQAQHFLDPVFIWTGSKEDIYYQFCTAAKVSPRHILTAAHCILEQEETEEVFQGPWVPYDGIKVGSHIQYSFDRDLSNENHKVEQLVIKNISLPRQVEDCLEGVNYSKRICESRTPWPDVAIIEVEPIAKSTFSQVPVLDIDYSHVKENLDIYILGYGSQYDGDESLPKLKFHPISVLSKEKAMERLESTNAVDDGFPDFDIYFATGGALNEPDSANLGSGDSGGPVISKMFQKLIGINSDGYCPRGIRGCEVANNSVFTRINKDSEHGVGEWIESILVP